MSYSQDLKNELCRRTLHCGSCPEALLYGMLLFSRAAREALFVSENRRAAALFAQTAAELTGAIVTVRDPETASRRPAYTVWLEDDSCREELLGRFLLEGERDSIRPELLRRECCAMSFLRGAYLACGTMSDPQGEYHLEFGVPDTSLGEELLEVLELYELDFRQSSRGRNPIVYTKESNQIEDFLARIGAPKAAMELMNLKIEKELRNKVNLSPTAKPPISARPSMPVWSRSAASAASRSPGSWSACLPPCGRRPCSGWRIRTLPSGSSASWPAERSAALG